MAGTPAGSRGALWSVGHLRLNAGTIELMQRSDEAANDAQRELIDADAWQVQLARDGASTLPVALGWVPVRARCPLTTPAAKTTTPNSAWGAFEPRSQRADAGGHGGARDAWYGSCASVPCARC